MESAELNEQVTLKPKRLKHCFRRSEIYHQWVHEDRYVYTNDNHPIVGIGNYLLIGYRPESCTIEDIIEYWNNWYQDRCVAIIDRDNKRILINTYYNYHTYDLWKAVPDDYELFFIDTRYNGIPSATIFSTGEVDELLRLQATYLVRKYMQQELEEAYVYLQCAYKTIHFNVDSYYDKCKIEKEYKYKHHYDYISYNEICSFVKHYKLRGTELYNNKLEGTVDLSVYKGWSTIRKIRKPLLSLKDIVLNKVFTKKEIFKLRQGWFYSTYCYGYGISFKDVEKYWDSLYDKEYIKVLYKTHNISGNLDEPLVLQDSNTPVITWKDSIIYYHNVFDNQIKANLDYNLDKSRKNYEAACKILADTYGKASINDFREYKSNNMMSDRSTTYEKFMVDSYKHGTGHWITGRVFYRPSFDNTQLRLSKDNNIVETSRHAKVPLADAIKLYKLYLITRKRHTFYNTNEESKKCIIRFDNDNIKVGIYNLRAIMFVKKTTDDYKPLDKWEWCVVIGCHHIWIDDFMDFVHYYNLYDKFNITKSEI